MHEVINTRHDIKPSIRIRRTSGASAGMRLAITTYQPWLTTFWRSRGRWKRSMLGTHRGLHRYLCFCRGVPNTIKKSFKLTWWQCRLIEMLSPTRSIEFWNFNLWWVSTFIVNVKIFKLYLVQVFIKRLGLLWLHLTLWDGPEVQRHHVRR